MTPTTLPARETVDAVIFDAGGVLLLPDAEAGRAAIAGLHDESVAADWHRAHYAALVALEQMEPIDWSAHRRVIAAEVGVRDEHLDAAATLIEDVMASTWVPVDGAADTLRALSAAGYKLAVVSNAWGTIEQWLEQHKVCSVTDDELPRVGVVIDSHLVGIEKPDPRIFQLALDALDVVSDRSLYVGDTVRFDVKGALAAGLQPVHVDPYGFCDGPHTHIASLAELTDWLVAD
ncbi:MAG: HAD family hydrolase [Streptosporangiaceae bacterium]